MIKSSYSIESSDCRLIKYLVLISLLIHDYYPSKKRALNDRPNPRYTTYSCFRLPFDANDLSDTSDHDLHQRYTRT